MNELEQQPDHFIFPNGEEFFGRIIGTREVVEDTFFETTFHIPDKEVDAAFAKGSVCVLGGKVYQQQNMKDYSGIIPSCLMDWWGSPGGV